jgi:hypothetical protein
LKIIEKKLRLSEGFFLKILCGIGAIFGGSFLEVGEKNCFARKKYEERNRYIHKKIAFQKKSLHQRALKIAKKHRIRSLKKLKIAKRKVRFYKSRRGKGKYRHRIYILKKRVEEAQARLIFANQVLGYVKSGELQTPQEVFTRLHLGPLKPLALPERGLWLSPYPLDDWFFIDSIEPNGEWNRYVRSVLSDQIMIDGLSAPDHDGSLESRLVIENRMGIPEYRGSRMVSYHPFYTLDHLIFRLIESLDLPENPYEMELNRSYSIHHWYVIHRGRYGNLERPVTPPQPQEIVHQDGHQRRDLNELYALTQSVALLPLLGSNGLFSGHYREGLLARMIEHMTGGNSNPRHDLEIRRNFLDRLQNFSVVYRPNSEWIREGLDEIQRKKFQPLSLFNIVFRDIPEDPTHKLLMSAYIHDDLVQLGRNRQNQDNPPAAGHIVDMQIRKILADEEDLWRSRLMSYIRHPKPPINPCAEAPMHDRNFFLDLGLSYAKFFDHLLDRPKDWLPTARTQDWRSDRVYRLLGARSQNPQMLERLANSILEQPSSFLMEEEGLLGALTNNLLHDVSLEDCMAPDHGCRFYNHGFLPIAGTTDALLVMNYRAFDIPLAPWSRGSVHPQDDIAIEPENTHILLSTARRIPIDQRQEWENRLALL